MNYCARIVFLVLIAAGVSACSSGGGDSTDPAATYSVGGTITGLSGTGLVLRNNNADDLSISPGTTSFTFATKVADNAGYAVTVSVQPSGQNCTVNNGAGTIAGADVTNVAVICSSNSYSVAGTVTGLLGTGLVLQNNLGDDLPVTSSTFIFPAKVADTAGYDVTVKTQPTNPNQTCTVNNGVGMIAGDDVTNVTVSCVTNNYSIGGTVTGLQGSGLVLRNNGGDDLPVVSSTFTFPAKVEDKGSYEVTVLFHPSNPNQICAVNNGVGSVAGADVTNVSVVCSTPYSLGGTVNGLSGSGLVLQYNGANDLPVSAGATSFSFPQMLTDGSSYTVTVQTQPSGQKCAVSNANGQMAGADVANVVVDCGAGLSVAPLYPANGANWNRYVKNDGGTIFSATGTACAGTETGGYDACLHGGEMRVATVTGKSACTGLTATDALDAFNWTCDASTNPVKFFSTGLKDGKHLSDLIDFSTPGWKSNAVIVKDGSSVYGVTENSAWWSNPVVPDNDGGTLATAGTVYVVTDDALTDGYIINASSIALVAKPGVVINGPKGGSTSFVVEANGASGGAKNFLWVEGNIDATGDDVGVSMNTVKFSVMRNVVVANADGGWSHHGVALDASNNNRIQDVTAEHNLGVGIRLYLSSYNTLSRVTSSYNGENGFLITGASVYNELSDIHASGNVENGIRFYWDSNANRVTNVTVSNNKYGLYLFDVIGNRLSHVVATGNGTGVMLWTDATANILSDVTTSNNGTGLKLADRADDNVVQGLTSANNLYGVLISGGSNNVVSGTIAANNGQYGFDLGSVSEANLIADVAAADGDSYGVYLEGAADNNRFTGQFKVGNNAPADCYVVYGSTNPGLDDDAVPGDVTDDTAHDGLCVQQGASDFGAAITGVSVASSFVGKVTTDDTANASDSNGSALYASVVDWTNFAGTYRGWGRDGGAFPSADNAGRCVAGETCRIWDWSLLATDTVVRNALTLPTGNDTLTHTWSSGATTVTFLRNAMEIQGDGIGNDNGLCESTETCLYTPNIGAYQGHGNLISAGVFTNGTITGVTLMKYETNGY